MNFDPISQALDTAFPIAQLERPKSTALLPAPTDEIEKEAPEIDEDFREARANLKELITQAMDQIPDLMNLVQQSQSDKMISAVSGWMKTAADLNTSMSKLSKEIKRKPTPKQLPGSPDAPAQITQNNSVFVGSTEEFLRMLSERDKAPAIDAEYTEVQSE